MRRIICLVFITVISLLFTACSDKNKSSNGKDTYLERFLDKYSDTGYCMELSSDTEDRTVIITDDFHIDKRATLSGEYKTDHYSFKNADYRINHYEKTYYAYENIDNDMFDAVTYSYFGMAEKLIDTKENDNGQIIEMWQSPKMTMAGKDYYIKSEYTFDKESGELKELYCDDGFNPRFKVISVTNADSSMSVLPDLEGYTNKSEE